MQVLKVLLRIHSTLTFECGRNDVGFDQQFDLHVFEHALSRCSKAFLPGQREAPESSSKELESSLHLFEWLVRSGADREHSLDVTLV